MDVVDLARQAHRAAQEFGQTSADKRTELLQAMESALESQRVTILAANVQDTSQARDRLSAAMLDRLTLTDERFSAMLAGVRQLAQSKDVLGETLRSWTQPNGLQFQQRRVPLGVVAILYESRPNVTADAAAICVRSGNVSLLRGGSEARQTNRAIVSALQDACEECGLPREVVSFLDSSDRADVTKLLQCEQYIDLVIPRGGEGLIRTVTEQSRIPVLKHYKGICHIFVDASADIAQAVAVCRNAKVQRPGVCNAMETLLVHRSLANTFLKELAAKLPEVSFRACTEAAAILQESKAHVQLATSQDWDTEHLALILNVRVVADVSEAMDHIAQHGSRHTEAILTRDQNNAQAFAQQVDAGVVMLNASTRFNDGGEFGFGAEIGISTDKLHARGPVGVEGLTTYKYIVSGEGTVRN